MKLLLGYHGSNQSNRKGLFKASLTLFSPTRWQRNGKVFICTILLAKANVFWMRTQLCSRLFGSPSLHPYWHVSPVPWFSRHGHTQLLVPRHPLATTHAPFYRDSIFSRKPSTELVMLQHPAFTSILENATWIIVVRGIRGEGWKGPACLHVLFCYVSDEVSS